MKKEIISSVIVALGLCCAGILVYCGLSNIAFKDRFVTVKGLSEKDVQADYVSWPLHFAVSGNNLQQLSLDRSQQAQRIETFLQQKGFTAEDMHRGTVSLNDNWDNYYTTRRPEFHYTLNSSVVLSTRKVSLLVSNPDLVNEMIEKGILVQSWGMDYQYKSLTELKPSMVAEATQNARVVAQRFADDAQCQLGSIRNANQGQFTMENDSEQPWLIHIRVVSTLQYYLK